MSPATITQRDRCDYLCLQGPSGVELGRMGHSVSGIGTADAEDSRPGASHGAWGPSRPSAEAWRVRAGTLASVPRRSFRISDWKLCGQVWEGEIVVWQVGNDWRQTSNSGDVSVRVRLDVQKARIPMISSLRTRRYLIT